MTGIQLGQFGLRVAVVERWPDRYPQPRACGLHHDAMRVLQSAALGPGMNSFYEPAIGPERSYVFRNGEGEVLLEIEWNKPGDSGWPEVVTFYQPDLEDLFEARLSELPNVEIHRGWEVYEVDQTDEVATAWIRDATGQRRSDWRASAAWVIGADGANSLVRDAMGSTTTDLGFAYDWLVVDTLQHVSRDWWPYFEQRCDPARPTTCVPSGPGGRRRWEFMLLETESTEEMSTGATCWQLLEPWGITPSDAELVRHSVYTFRARWSEPWRNGRLLLAGDSAHVMPPFLGQGLGSGLRDARALAWRLHLVHQRICAADVLDSYGVERSGHVRQIIDHAVSLGQVICERDPIAAAERDQRMLAAREQGTPGLEPLAPWRLGPGIGAPGDPSAGLLAIQGRVGIEGTTGLLDDLIGAGFVLIGADGDPAEHLSAANAVRWGCIGGKAVHIGPGSAVSDIDESYSQWFEALGASVALVRPDFHIFGSGQSAQDADRLVTELLDSLALAL